MAHEYLKRISNDDFTMTGFKKQIIQFKILRRFKMQSEFKIKVNHFNNWTHHQYGWKGAMSDLKKQINSVHKDSVLLEPCIEDTFITNYYKHR